MLDTQAASVVGMPSTHFKKSWLRRDFELKPPLPSASVSASELSTVASSEGTASISPPPGSTSQMAFTFSGYPEFSSRSQAASQVSAEVPEASAASETATISHDPQPWRVFPSFDVDAVIRGVSSSSLSPLLSGKQRRMARMPPPPLLSAHTMIDINKPPPSPGYSQGSAFAPGTPISRSPFSFVPDSPTLPSSFLDAGGMSPILAETPVPARLVALERDWLGSFQLDSALTSSVRCSVTGDDDNESPTASTPPQTSPRKVHAAAGSPESGLGCADTAADDGNVDSCRPKGRGLASTRDVERGESVPARRPTRLSLPLARLSRGSFSPARSESVSTEENGGDEEEDDDEGGEEDAGSGEEAGGESDQSDDNAVVASYLKPSSGGAPKTCLHCGTSKTPLWRNGPPGPKSLCNACGIRFNKIRSGKRKPTPQEAIMLQKYEKDSGGASVARCVPSGIRLAVPSKEPLPLPTAVVHRSRSKLHCKKPSFAARTHVLAHLCRVQSSPAKAERSEEEKAAAVAGAVSAAAAAGAELLGGDFLCSESELSQQSPAFRSGKRERVGKTVWLDVGAVGQERVGEEDDDEYVSSSEHESCLSEPAELSPSSPKAPNEADVRRKRARSMRCLLPAASVHESSDHEVQEPRAVPGRAIRDIESGCFKASLPEMGRLLEDEEARQKELDVGFEMGDSDVEMAARLLMDIFHGVSPAAACC